jgi:hypothetical protein
MDATTGVTPASRESEEHVDTPALDRAEVRRELEATLSARRELGPEYDPHLADAFIEKVTTQLSAQLAEMQRQVKRATPPEAPSHDQRLGLAIVSICMLVLLTAIVLGIGAGLGGLAMLLALILAINLGFRYL